MPPSLRCLVTGASGYIGGRLVPELLSAGYAVRCMARDPGKLSDRPWSDEVEVEVADALDADAVRRALEDVDERTAIVHASAAALWRVIEGIGGETGWYSFPAAWAVRGLLDRPQRQRAAHL